MLRNKQGQTEAKFLANDPTDTSDRLSVAADILIFTVMAEEKTNYRKLSEKVLQVLMLKRGEHPYLGDWSLPGGFVKREESLEAAAYRELREKTRMDNVYMEQLYTWGDTRRDPRSRVISTSYLSLLDSSALQMEAGEEPKDARWFTVSCKLLQENKTITTGGYTLEQYVRLGLQNEESLYAILKIKQTVAGRQFKIEREIVESQGIAFDHAAMIAYALERLRNKIEYTELAFHLMPEYFTLTELQQVYEIILDRELLKANFRRKIADRVIETKYFTKDAGHRPSKLFKFNPNWNQSMV